jgi:heat shock protein HtpX
VSADAPDLFEQQRINRSRSRWLIGFFVWFFAWLGFSGDFALREATRSGHLVGFEYFFPWLTVAMLAIGIVVVVYGWNTGGRKVLWATGARPLLEAASADEKLLLDVVEEMSIAAGIQRPRVFLLDDDDPNAFATGRDERDACLVVTRGMLRVCSRDELQAVIAHEIGHIKNLDVRLMTLLATLVGAVALMSNGASRVLFNVSVSRDDGNDKKRTGDGDAELGVMAIVFFAVWIVTWLLAPLVTRLIALAVGRDREFLADAMSAQFTRNPGALAMALHKIDAAEEPTASIKGGVAHLCICDPLGRPVNDRRGFFANLLATHPPMEERIAALKEMAYGGAPETVAAPAVAPT